MATKDTANADVPFQAANWPGPAKWDTSVTSPMMAAARPGRRGISR
jgi:hypothetical protein